MEQVVVKPRENMPEGARTLPARYYTDPVLFEKELSAAEFVISGQQKLDIQIVK